MGVSLADIVDHVKQSLPEFKEKGISRHTIHHLLAAPHKNRVAACCYRVVVEAKVPPKRNTVHSYHKDGHYRFAHFGYVSEFCAMFSDECQQVSCDDMNKLNVGTLPVSRYHQLFRFFHVVDAANYLDHDFPYRNSKIIPSGCLLLQEQPSSRDRMVRSRSTSPVRHHMST